MYDKYFYTSSNNVNNSCINEYLERISNVLQSNIKENIFYLFKPNEGPTYF